MFVDEITFQKFINLVELDQKIDQLSHETETLKKDVAALQQQEQLIQQQTHIAYQKFHTLRKSLDALELDLKALDELLKEKRFRLSMAASPKEFFSLESEINDLEKKHNAGDDTAIELINQLEEAQTNYERIKTQEHALIGEKRQALTKLEERLTYVTELRRAYVEKHVAYEKDVPQELLAKYVAMKDRVTNPVVEILKDSCSACFYAVNKPDLLEAEKQQLIACKDCYRLLYKGSYGKQDISS